MQEDLITLLAQFWQEGKREGRLLKSNSEPVQGVEFSRLDREFKKATVTKKSSHHQKKSRRGRHTILRG